MKTIADDIGLFASTDPVAIDQACLDILRKRTGKNLFSRGDRTLVYAERIGLGSREYTLIAV